MKYLSIFLFATILSGCATKPTKPVNAPPTISQSNQAKAQPTTKAQRPGNLTFSTGPQHSVQLPMPAPLLALKPGQTPNEVLAILGKPNRVPNRQVWVYNAPTQHPQLKGYQTYVLLEFDTSARLSKLTTYTRKAK